MFSVLSRSKYTENNTTFLSYALLRSLEVHSLLLNRILPPLHLPPHLKEAVPMPPSYSRKLSNSVINRVIIDRFRLEPWRGKGRTALWVNPANSSEMHVGILMSLWWFDQLGYWRQSSAACYERAFPSQHWMLPWSSAFGPTLEQLLGTGPTDRGWKSPPSLATLGWEMWPRSWSSSGWMECFSEPWDMKKMQTWKTRLCLWKQTCF